MYISELVVFEISSWRLNEASIETCKLQGQGAPLCLGAASHMKALPDFWN